MRFGEPFRRVEDDRLLRGEGRYVADVAFDNHLHLHVVRSPYAHARIVAIDVVQATRASGVVDVMTFDDLAAAGIGGLPTKAAIVNKDGTPQATPPYPLLADRTVRFVGQPVAAIVAETLAQAEDAADLIVVDYADRQAVTDAAKALEPGAPRIWDEIPHNLCFDWQTGDEAAVDAAFASASNTTVVDLVNNRVTANPIETRGAIGAFDAANGRYTLTACNQGVHFLQADLSKVLGINEADLRIVTPDVGGGFGMKFVPYPEQALVLWLARCTGRPVRWIATRSEAFISDAQARDHRSHVELAFDVEGRFLALKADTIANLGAYLTQYGSLIPTDGVASVLPGPYAVPAIHLRVRGVFTNTVPVDAYRGAGQPEATYARERVIDAAAQKLAIDPAILRQRNLVTREAMPYTTATGLIYDDGDFDTNHRMVLDASDWKGFAQRRAAARAKGRWRGIGMVDYVEVTGREEVGDTTRLRFEPSGQVTLIVGSVSNGQGHDTAYVQLLRTELGIAPQDIHIVSGDSDVIAPDSTGYSGSHFLQVAGPGTIIVATRARDKARLIAAHAMEVAPEDVEFDIQTATFRIAGTDRQTTLAEVVALAFDPQALPEDMEPGIDEVVFYRQKDAAYANGSHVCEVEVDADTGTVEIKRYTVVDDFGRVLNPLLVSGQVHGGVAQGIGQALLENCVYDAGSGQPLTGSFLDYALPRADNLPAFDVAYNEIPCLNNPLGVKGCGEAGTTAAGAAVVNALHDALRHAGVDHIIDMPATSERVWRALRDAGALPDDPASQARAC